MKSSPSNEASNTASTHAEITSTGVSVHKVSIGDHISQWIDQHKKISLDSMHQLFKRPAGSLLTIIVLSLALALPFGLGLVTKNISSFNQHWDGELSISVYLKVDSNATAEQIKKIVSNWSSQPSIKSVKLISPEEALDTVSEYSDAKTWVEELGSNPLPWVAVVIPTNQSESGLQTLSSWLKNQDVVQDIQLDNQWVKRLNSIYEFLRAIFWILALALGGTALMIVTNTLRLEVENRKEEIFVVRLVGGTDTYVRRPFLYTGFWYGLLGSILALVLLILSGLLLTEFVRNISTMYNSKWSLAGPDWLDIGSLLICGITLGLAGAWIAVNKHLKNETAEEKIIY